MARPILPLRVDDHMEMLHKAALQYAALVLLNNTGEELPVDKADEETKALLYVATVGHVVVEDIATSAN